jgi:hypothetical protein
MSDVFYITYFDSISESKVLRLMAREILSGLEQNEALLREILVERAKFTESEALVFLHQGETKDPTFALEVGVISDIREFALPPNAPIITANFG